MRLFAALLFTGLLFGQGHPLPSPFVTAGSTAGGTCGALAGDVTGTCAATVLATIPSGVQDAITRLGTIVSGVWHGTLVGVLYGGTGADLSATGGTSQVVKQSSAGAALTVGTLASTNLSDTAGLVRGAAALDTAGYVPFITSAGSLTINKTGGQQLFWDDANHRLGINNAAPTQALTVTGNATVSGTVLGAALNISSGNVAGGSTGIDVSAGSAIKGTHAATGNIPSVATCGTIGTGSKNNAGSITTATGACTPVVTFANWTAVTGWACTISNSTTPANSFQQTASTTTTATFTGVSASNDVIRYVCVPY